MRTIRVALAFLAAVLFAASAGPASAVPVGTVTNVTGSTADVHYTGLSCGDPEWNVQLFHGFAYSTQNSFTTAPCAPVDTTPPDTTITSGPANPTASTDASFAFTSTEAGSTFECQLNGAAYAACTSPKAYTGLTEGLQTFRVRAKDAAGNTDASPAEFSWNVSAFLSRWIPVKGQTFYWQLQGALASRHSQYQVIDVDGFDTSAATVASLHAEGKKVIAYFSAGTYEPGRPDSAQFPASVKGSGVDGWPGEYWLDTRATVVHDIMAARAALAASKGFDAVEWDNVDGYQNDPGFPLTSTTQLNYNGPLADMARAAGLAVFLKNDVDQLTDLQPRFDGAINEQCGQYSECGGYSVFLNANKPVFQVEYGTMPTTSGGGSRCTAAKAAGRKAYYAGTALSGTSRWQACP